MLCMCNLFLTNLISPSFHDIAEGACSLICSRPAVVLSTGLLQVEEEVVFYGGGEGEGLQVVGQTLQRDRFFFLTKLG